MQYIELKNYPGNKFLFNKIGDLQNYTLAVLSFTSNQYGSEKRKHLVALICKNCNQADLEKSSVVFRHEIKSKAMSYANIYFHKYKSIDLIIPCKFCN